MSTIVSPEEYGKFYQETVRVLYGYVLARVGNAHDAEDICSQAYMKLWDRMRVENIRGMKAYLFQIGKNLLKDHYRVQAHAVSLDDPENEYLSKVISKRQGSEEIERLSERTISVESVRKILQHLSDEERTILELRYVQELKWGEVAHYLGINIIAVRVTHHRLIKKIRTIIGQI